jgi:hypothetical protein
MPKSYLPKPYHLAPHNATVIYHHIQLAFIELHGDKFDFIIYLENLKKNNPALHNEIFLQQNLQQDADYQAIIRAINPLKTLTCQNFLSNPNRVYSLMNPIQEKSMHFLQQQKQKYETTPSTLKEKQTFWQIYQQGIEKIHQPCVNFFTRINPDELFSQAMRYYIQKIMYADGPSIKLQTDREKLACQAPTYFLDRKSCGMNLSYENEATTIYKIVRKGNVGDAMALAMAVRGLHPLAIRCQISGTFFLRHGAMEPGLIHCCTLGFAGIGRWLERKKYKRDVIKGAFENGIPLENISIIAQSVDIDVANYAIRFSNSERKKINKKWEKWGNDFFAQIDKACGEKKLPLELHEATAETTPLLATSSNAFAR